MNKCYIHSKNDSLTAQMVPASKVRYGSGEALTPAVKQMVHVD